MRRVRLCRNAARALALLLKLAPVQPLRARVASDNVGSLKVLQKKRFTITGAETSFANRRSTETEETVLRLDQPADAAPCDVVSGPG